MDDTTTGTTDGHAAHADRLSAPVEREAKFSVGPRYLLPDLGGVAGSVEVLVPLLLRASYIDTPDLALWRHGITLRHRTGEGPSEGQWTVKLPLPERGPTLDRSELSWPGPPGPPPGEVTTLLRAVLRGAPLEVVAEITTRRRRLALSDAEGTALAEVDDDLVTVDLEGLERGSFRQIEVEMEPGVDALLGPVSERITRAGARRTDEPKLARALAMVDRTPAVGSPVDRASSTGEVARASIAEGLQRIVDHDVRLRLDADDPPVHSVHQARVATRRLRSDLLLLGSALDPVWVERTRRDLQWLGRALGAVRDADVLAEELDAVASGVGSLPFEPAGLDDLRSVLADRRAERARALATAIGDPRYVDLLHRLDRAARSLPTGDPGMVTRPDRPAAEVLPALVSTRWRALRKEVRRGGKRPTDAQLHRIRIRAKQLRYAAELAAPVLGRDARRVAEAAAAAQGLLGDLHDTVTAEEWLAAVSRDVPGPTAFSAGVVAGEQARRRALLRRQWKGCWRRIDRPKVRGWLDRG